MRRLRHRPPFRLGQGPGFLTPRQVGHLGSGRKELKPHVWYWVRD